MKAVTTTAPQRRQRQSQAERRERTRTALLEAAARGFSRQGYANLALEQVAKDAGYTRGALYHLFAGKEALALAVVEWVSQTWNQEVARPATKAPDPVASLVTLARGHAVYCRRDIAKVMMNLRVELAGQGHPVGRAIEEGVGQLVDACARLITAGRKSGAIPPGPPPRVTALAFAHALEALVIGVAGQAPHDVELAERAVRGILGLPTKTS